MDQKLIISQRAFWDVDFEKLMSQVDNYPEFIIRKVFEHGTFDDVLKILNYFGQQKIIEVLTKTIYLPEITLHFAAAFFKIDKTNFLCYTNKPQRHFYSKRCKI